MIPLSTTVWWEGGGNSTFGFAFEDVCTKPKAGSGSGQTQFSCGRGSQGQLSRCHVQLWPWITGSAIEMPLGRTNTTLTKMLTAASTMLVDAPLKSAGPR